MRDVSERRCRENQKAHFMLKTFFLTLPFMRQRGKIWQATDANIKSRCVLHAK